ncbi:AT-rich interactive domain-containing protein 1A-like [Panicum virgatum]|uniref:RING-type domain-containing protein n=2 Tax=Panicum virgatum TaxID=38727 RepID=A0A8T0TDH2_PANVG|nr:AT-rich interactive domain-containing protein 1A-like [Panicum virgatum]KAG2607215.1 hypothetical protein PVAP13_4NG182400 [Panicum virgatum]
MGFDNECISNIQSLPGEYFCPVCRTLIYPNEAVQTQCTHLYCKPCLSYVVATTKACPYDGYLVTEADSKPLMESNKTLAETIGKVTVHCLYHKSGCQWYGTLSACVTHGTTCAYGNSPVICNRCGTQIVHRQVQEHAQLCHGLQSQTQQADGTQAQPVAATQAVTQDPSPAAATATTLPFSSTATAATDSASATGGAAAPGSASQTPTAQQSYQQQQLQYSQYYQQQHPGSNPYMQQYQQYGQYQQVYQQYPQPPLQALSQNMMHGSAQLASYVQPQVQSTQSQYVMPSQPQSQAQLQPSTGHPQLQQHPVQSQPQSQAHLPHLQVPAGQSQPHQPIQPALQVPQLQPQSQVALQVSAPQVQPAAHTPAPTPVGNQQFANTSTQAMTPHVQPHVQAQPPQQQQHAHLHALPPQQNLQPQMQLNSQAQLETPQVSQQSYPQPQAYAQQTHHMHPQNASYPQQQMPHGTLLQQTVHASHQQAPISQHPALMRPPLPGQQPGMLPPQGVQHATQNQQHVGYYAQWPPMYSNIPSQAPQQGLSPHSSVSSQSVQPYQQGMPLSQQQVHSQPGQPYTQQHVPGNTGHHVQTSAGRPASHLAPPQQFQHQQPTTHRTESPAAGKPIGQGSLDLETHASKSGKSENTSNAVDNTAVSENKNNGAESAVMRPTMTQSFGDENMNKHNSFGGVRKDVGQTGIASHGVDGSIGRDGISDRACNFHGPVTQGGKDHKTEDASTNHGKGGSFKQISQKNAGPLGSYVSPGMGPQHPSGPDRMLPQHMMPPGHKHGFSENIRPPLQQPYGLFHSGMTPRPSGENQIQMPMSQSGGIDGMIRPHMVGSLAGHHDAMLPPFVENLGHPPVSGRHEELFNTSGEHLRSRAAYPGRHDNMEDGLKQFPGPAHLDGQGLQSGSRAFERGLDRPDGFLDSLPGRPPFPNQRSPFPVGLHEDFSRKPNATVGHPAPGAEFDHHRTDGMPIFRNPGALQGMSGGPHGPRKDQFGSGTLPGNLQHSFGGPEFPPTRFNHGHMHPGDPNLVADYGHHGFPTESAHFGLAGPFINRNVGWCRICMFNCGSAENLDLHVQTMEHQQCAMDIVLKMKQDVAKRQKLNYGGAKSFHNKKVAGKGHFRGNRR